MQGRGNNILVGTVVKAKVGELEEEVREGFLRILRKELTGVVQVVSGKKRLLVRFKYGRENYMKSNQLTIGTVENIPMEEEPDVSTVDVIPDEKVPLGKRILSWCPCGTIF